MIRKASYPFVVLALSIPSCTAAVTESNCVISPEADPRLSAALCSDIGARVANEESSVMIEIHRATPLILEATLTVVDKPEQSTGPMRYSQKDRELTHASAAKFADLLVRQIQNWTP